MTSYRQTGRFVARKVSLELPLNYKEFQRFDLVCRGG